MRGRLCGGEERIWATVDFPLARVPVRPIRSMVVFWIFWVFFWREWGGGGLEGGGLSGGGMGGWMVGEGTLFEDWGGGN